MRGKGILLCPGKELLQEDTGIRTQKFIQSTPPSTFPVCQALCWGLGAALLQGTQSGEGSKQTNECDAEGYT